MIEQALNGAYWIGFWQGFLVAACLVAGVVALKRRSDR